MMKSFSASSFDWPPPSKALSCLQRSNHALPSFNFQISCSIRLTDGHNLPPHSTKRRSSSSLLNATFGAAESCLNFLDRPLHVSLDPTHVLAGNFAPVPELPPTECEITQGSLPSCLDGVYIRAGPNPQYRPPGPYHLFDGDGMLHSVRISNGRATLCSRFVKTYKFMRERELGASIVPSLFCSINGLPAFLARIALFGARTLFGQYDVKNGIGVANTSVAFFGDKLYALGESDLPYALCLTAGGDIGTLGRVDFDKKLLRNMTAHPKIDPETGEAFAFQCKYDLTPPFLTYFRFDAKGNKQSEVPIFSMSRPSFIHDFAITKTHAIIQETQLVVKPLNMVLKGRCAVEWEPDKVPRIGVIPRYAEDESEMRWFDVPGLNALHILNAWDEDEGKGIAMIVTNVLFIEHLLYRTELVHPSLEKIRIDLNTGVVTRHTISERKLEFAVMNPKCLAKRNQYVYSGISHKLLKFSGVAKLDVSRLCTVGSRMYGESCYGGEPFFVAREGAEDEDDGYLLVFVHDENTEESKFLVMDAKSEELDIVATLKLPQRVPYGFHGLFLSEAQLRHLSTRA